MIARETWLQYVDSRTTLIQDTYLPSQHSFPPLSRLMCLVPMLDKAVSITLTADH